MKTCGILGGMSSHSTQIYYRELCALTSSRLGGLHSPDLLIRSLDFDHIARLQSEGKWDELGGILNNAAVGLERGGADLLLLATNTMHKVADRMMAGVTIPLLHIGDATALAILRDKRQLRRPGLMATAFTMEQSFYVDRLEKHGLEAVVPEKTDRDVTHRIIYEELCKGVIRKESEAEYVAIAQRLINDQGADCLILGCTEVGMLLNSGNVKVPVFDTTLIHCEEALRMMLG
ncbi:uncharacterized protein AB675_5899 [Cyphellophora attinorum]|uniref:Aspartate racemase n=1 Tax=Cyphellophora attinorum TaxID=1664694 RepID=A0A0N1HS77_9EURO|nr:uncharacterized protein AB675_5899 [Phialophora attinorum]KPI38916.1 hypothetical protein AB675_5899 [Phialophora attinorum]